MSIAVMLVHTMATTPAVGRLNGVGSAGRTDSLGSWPVITPCSISLAVYGASGNFNPWGKTRKRKNMSGGGSRRTSVRSGAAGPG